jgi:hypothetical protein
MANNRWLVVFGDGPYLRVKGKGVQSLLRWMGVREWLYREATREEVRLASQGAEKNCAGWWWVSLVGLVRVLGAMEAEDRERVKAWLDVDAVERRGLRQWTSETTEEENALRPHKYAAATATAVGRVNGEWPVIVVDGGMSIRAPLMAVLPLLLSHPLGEMEYFGVRN